jgi:hypothetical protein
MVPVISANALLVCVGILHGARLGARYLGHGAIVGDGVARAAVILTGRDA